MKKKLTHRPPQPTKHIDNCTAFYTVLERFNCFSKIIFQVVLWRRVISQALLYNQIESFLFIIHSRVHLFILCVFLNTRTFSTPLNVLVSQLDFIVELEGSQSSPYDVHHVDLNLSSIYLLDYTLD